MGSLIVGRFFNCALDFVHLLRLRAGGEFGQLNLHLLDRLVLLDDGLVKRLQQLFHVGDAGLNIDDPLILRHADTVHELIR